MKEFSRGLPEKLLDWLLRLLLRRKIADNQHYIIETWERFERFNRGRTDDDLLSFDSYAIFGGGKWLWPEMRVKIVASAAYQALRDHVGLADSDRVTINYFTPSSDYPGYCAFIYIWANSAKKA